MERVEKVVHAPEFWRWVFDGTERSVGELSRLLESHGARGILHEAAPDGVLIGNPAVPPVVVPVGGVIILRVEPGGTACVENWAPDAAILASEWTPVGQG